MCIKTIKNIIILSSFIFFYSCGKKDDKNSGYTLEQRTCPFSSGIAKENEFSTLLGSSLEANGKFKLQSIQLLPLSQKSLKILNSKPSYTSDIINDQKPLKERDYTAHGVFSFTSSNSIDLGMANVPVFDQGPYGTCVTFAATAAIDAIFNLGDFISQQCTLMLTRALGNNYWDGAYEAAQIITPLQEYGVVSQTNCPFMYPDRYATLTLEKYKEITEEYISIESNIDNKAQNLLMSSIKHQYYPNISLDIVRQALRNGHRILFGFGVLSSHDTKSIGGLNCKVNCEHKVGGLWACQQPGDPVNYCSHATAGHEAIIIGFDDSQEVLKIRNSWGPDLGDAGDFYMTYAFFNAMGIDGTEIY